MKSKILLTMSAALLATTLVGCGGGNNGSENGSGSESASAVSPSESSKGDSKSEGSSIDVDLLANLLENLGDYNFKATCGDEEDGVYMTFYALGEDLIYIDYTSNMVKDEGYVAIDGDVYYFTNVNGEFAIEEWVLTLEEGESLYDYVLSPAVLLLADFDDEGDGEFSTDDEALKSALSHLTGNEDWAIDYIDEIQLSVGDGGDSATITALYSTDKEDKDLKIEISDFGTAAIESIEQAISNHDYSLPSWPSDDIADLLSQFTDNAGTTLPELEGKDYDTMPIEYVEYYGYGYVAVSGVGDQTADYAATLLNEGWTLRSNGDYLSPLEDIEVNLLYDEEQGYFLIAFSEPAILEFPSEAAAAIVEALAPGSLTVVPDFLGADEYDLYHDTEIDAYTEDLTLGEAYVSTLLGAGWTLTDDGYLSPEEDIILHLGYNEDYDCFEIVLTDFVGMFRNWPSMFVADYLGEKVTDALPKFTGGNRGFAFESGNGKCEITVFTQIGYEADALDWYLNDLDQAGYTYGSDDAYRSPNSEIYCELSTYEQTGEFVITFWKDEWFNATESFPFAKIDAFLSANYFEFSFGESFEAPMAPESGYLLTEKTTQNFIEMRVRVKGDYFSQWRSAIQPLITENGYIGVTSREEGSDKLVQWSTDSVHYIDVATDGIETNVRFWVAL